MPRYWRRITVALCALITMTGWGRALARPEGEKASDPVVTVTRVDEAAFKARLASLKGKVVLVNLWATWCVPCVEEFPHLVTLADRYRDRGLDVIALSVDEVDSLQATVIPFLVSRRATMTALIKETTDDERFINAISPAWRGVLPTTFLYDRSGVLRRTLTGKQTLDAFEAAVRPLLDETR